MKRTRIVTFATGWLLILLSLRMYACLESFSQGSTWAFWLQKLFWDPIALLGLGSSSVGAGLCALPMLIATAILLWSVPAMVISIRLNRPVGPLGLPFVLLLVWSCEIVGQERHALSSGFYMLAAGFTVLTAALILPDVGRGAPERRGFPVPPILPSNEWEGDEDELPV